VFGHSAITPFFGGSIQNIKRRQKKIMEMRIFDHDGIDGVFLKDKHTLQITKLMLRCT